MRNLFNVFRKKAKSADIKPDAKASGKANNPEKGIVEHFAKVAEEMGMMDLLGDIDGAKNAVSRMFQRGVEAFEFYNPANKQTFAMDSADFRERLGSDSATAIKRITPNIGNIQEKVKEEYLAHFSNYSFIGFPLCAQLAVHPIINIACSQAGKDSIATGFDLAFADKTENGDDADKTLEYLEALKKKCDILGVHNTCAKLDYNKRVFGSGIAVPIILRNGKQIQMDKPYNPDGINGAKFKGWRIVDPVWLTPVFSPDDTFDPTSEMFYKPTWYRLPMGGLIHHTWIIKVDNCEVADILKPTFYWCGVPLTQQIYQRVWCFDKTANEAPLLAMSKRMLIVDANVQQIYKNKKYIFGLMSIIKKCWHNWGVFFKNPDANVQQVDTTLTDMDELIFSQGQLVATIAGMPATKLLKTTPKGFNATGEYEWKDYAQHLRDIQKNEYTPLVERTVEILTAIEGALKRVVVTWNEVDAPTEEARANIENTKANTRSAYVQNGILTVEEVREAIRTDENGEYTHIEANNPELDKEAQMEEIMRKIENDDETDKEGDEQ